MTDRVQITVSLTKNALDILEKRTTARKRGEFLSNLIVAFGENESGNGQVDLEVMKLQLLGLASANKTLEARIQRLERQVMK